jgi:hypothetical protein
LGLSRHIHLKAGIHNKVGEKMKARAIVGCLGGFEGRHGHIYRVYLPDKDRVIRVRDVKFDESTQPVDIRIQ